MMTSNNFRLAIVLCGILLAAACQSASPTAPTEPEPEPEPEPVTLTGMWAGTFQGALIAGDGSAQLTQTNTAVTGDWSAPMPQALILLGAPANVMLAGPVTGTVTGASAELSFGFIETFAAYFGNTECGLSVSVSSFTATTMSATWTTNTSCQAPAVDQGTLEFTRQ